jgi:long-subunit fatty acid transport protein
MAISETTDALGADRTSTISFDTPGAYNLDFQTGIAANTLLFGSIRRANWDQLSVKPTDFATLKGGATMLDYDNHTTAYRIGLSRKLNDQWSIATTYDYDQATDAKASPFRPTDGYSAYGLGVTYTVEQLSVTVAAHQASIGDNNVPIAVSGVGTLDNAMSGNRGLMTVVKMAYKFSSS